MNDKFALNLKNLPELEKCRKLGRNRKILLRGRLRNVVFSIGGDTAKLKPQHFISELFSRQNESDFAKLFDDTLLDIAITNNDIFSVKTDGGAKVVLFDRIPNTSVTAASGMPCQSHHQQISGREL